MNLRKYIFTTIFLAYVGIVLFFTTDDNISENVFSTSANELTTNNDSLYPVNTPFELDTPFTDPTLTVDQNLSRNGVNTLFHEFENAVKSGNFEKAYRLREQIKQEYPGSKYDQAAGYVIETLETTQTVITLSDPVAKPLPTKPIIRTQPNRKKPATPIAKNTTTITRPSQQPDLTTPSFNPDIETALKKMHPVRDNQKQITWYYNKNVSHFVYKNSFEAYIGQSDEGDLWLRLRIYYNGKQWLKINTFDLFINDQKYTISTLYGKMERGRGRGGNWEWYDMQVSPKEVGMLKAMTDAERVSIRYIGQSGTWKRTISEGEKIRLSNTLKTYKLLSSDKSYISTAVKMRNFK